MTGILDKLQMKIFIDPATHSTWALLGHKIFRKEEVTSQMRSDFVHLNSGFLITIFLSVLGGLCIAQMIYYDDLILLSDQSGIRYAFFIYKMCEIIIHSTFLPMFLYFLLYGQHLSSREGGCKRIDGDVFFDRVKRLPEFFNKKERISLGALVFLIIFCLFSCSESCLGINDTFLGASIKYDSSSLSIVYHTLFASFSTAVLACFLFLVTYSFLLFRKINSKSKS